jgi:UDP-N-acetylglucosamine 2-epimerase (non-hydrolysing)
MIAFVLGTRPEIIKCAPVIHEARRRGVPFAIIHTGQHYTPELDELFFEELDVPQPVANIKVGSRPAPKQVAAILDGLHDIFLRIDPRVVIVEGDTNSVLGGSLCAHKMGIAVAHLEAGLRSDDWNMPEEGNRVLTGVVADYHFCPTELQRERLKQEGITEGVHVVGNTIVDATMHFSAIARSRSGILQRLGVQPGSFFLLTMHRPSNVDDLERLEGMMDMLDATAKALGKRIIFTVHPRTEKQLQRARLWGRDQRHSSFTFLPPIGYLDLLRLQSEAAVVFTDSGGIQEEANILRVPCVTLRYNTERPETIHAGGNILHGDVDADGLLRSVTVMMSRERIWPCPFGDGKTAQKVMDILKTRI